MRVLAALSTGLTLILPACGPEEAPTQPSSTADPVPVVTASAQASNTWAPRAPLPSPGHVRMSAGVVTNASGKSTVYIFGGISLDEGFVDWPVQAYDVTADAWTTKAAVTHGTDLNGVGRIGSRFYYSGGYFSHSDEHTNALVASPTTRPPTPGPTRPRPRPATTRSSSEPRRQELSARRGWSRPGAQRAVRALRPEACRCVTRAPRSSRRPGPSPLC